MSASSPPPAAPAPGEVPTAGRALVACHVAVALFGFASLFGKWIAWDAVAIVLGTPLSDVLHAQAAVVREAARRDLIERASRKEIAMLVPVVFLVMPTTVVFAFWPGLIGLSLSH